ncbi:hypothetical protein PRIPAC_80405 [Pristionchus pacificus]|uniref:G protein-coupled receptor n=1 Tax=Pristionchus pacificus TaxID=54126 RepID=A0A2A6C3P4_PRIPA|nr:hypothetical protein PRIPAC_76814 [Pristionchus pacificus]KAF8373976.1 hypothetical protein PRIPAC_80405 [Pristionchus pacificus]|eukprot:PDM72663.1 hypothetical protein PRIPAC_39097 [Pristionchus pacificus]
MNVAVLLALFKGGMLRSMSHASAAFDFILMYCWYHNSLSHIALNRITLSWTVFSYMYMTKNDSVNYSNEYVDLPVNSSCSFISMVAYIVINSSVLHSRSRNAIYRVVTVLNEINALTNASVYLLNNGEIKSSIRRMFGYTPSNVTTITTVFKLN